MINKPPGMFKTIILLSVFLLAERTAGQIQGDVLDPKEKGVAAVLVIAIDPDNKADTAKTDRRGFYEFKNLKPGKYRIEVKASGFQTIILKEVEVKEGETGAIAGEGDLYRGQRLDFDLQPVRMPVPG